MKKILLTALVLAGFSATAQVKVGSNPTTIDTGTTNFQVEGTTTAEQFVILKNGKVGIGTTTPTNKLQVNVDGTSGNNGILLLNQGGSSNVFSGMFAQHYTGTATAGHAAFLGFKALGTVASPLAVTAGSRVTGFGGYAHNGTTWAYAGSLDINTESDVTGVAETSLSWVNGTGLKFIVKHNGNMGIGTATPNADALLDISSTTKGLLLPRVALTSTTSFAPLSAHVAGMTVYNTATAGDVVPGTYQNDGTKWVKFGEAAPERNITRNVYVDTANPNTATLFSVNPYYPNRNCGATTPVASFTTGADAGLAGQSDALYIAQSGCDDNGDFAEYSYWVWDGTTYITFTSPKSSNFNLNPGIVDAGSDKLNTIRRDGGLIIGNENGNNAKSGAMIATFHRNSDTNTYQWGINNQVGGALSTSRVVHIRGEYNQAVVNTVGTPTITGSIYGTSNLVLRNAVDTDAGTIALMAGYNSSVGHNTATVTGTTTSIMGYEAASAVRGGTVTNLYDFYASNTTITGTGAVTNHWGLYIADSRKKSFLEGRLGIGTGYVRAKLHVLRTNPTGTIASTGTTITGTGTNFTTAFSVGEHITVGNVSKTVTAITNATTLTVDSAFTSDLPAGTSYNSINSWFDGGNVSIGNFTPTERLQVFGNTIVKQGSIANASLGEYRFGQTSTATVNASIGAIRGGGFHGQGSLVFKTSPDDTGAIERMRITDTGNVGIGTTTPTTLLQVAVPNGSIGDLSPIITTRNTGYGNTGGIYHILEAISPYGSGLSFRVYKQNVGLSEAFRVTNVGNVGIGTTNPTSKLQVVGLPVHATNAAAITAGLTVGAFYHAGDGIVRVVF